MYRFMCFIGFVHNDRISHYKHTRNRNDIVEMRDEYLEWISYYRANGYSIYYQNENWVFKHMTNKKVWSDKVSCSNNDYLTLPSGKGKRSIVSHIGSAESALLDGCLLLFRCSKFNILLIITET